MKTRRIFWVLGGSAVGKKHFIHVVTGAPRTYGLPEGLTPCWMPDGDMPVDQLLDLAAASPIIVRWQWGREGHIRHIAENNKAVRQTIYLVRAFPSVQVERVLQREGTMKFDEKTLLNEARDAEDLAETLSETYAIPVYFVRDIEKYECLDTNTP